MPILKIFIFFKLFLLVSNGSQICLFFSPKKSRPQTGKSYQLEDRCSDWNPVQLGSSSDVFFFSKWIFWSESNRLSSALVWVLPLEPPNKNVLSNSNIRIVQKKAQNTNHLLFTISLSPSLCCQFIWCINWPYSFSLFTGQASKLFLSLSVRFEFKKGLHWSSALVVNNLALFIMLSPLDSLCLNITLYSKEGERKRETFYKTWTDWMKN